MWDLDNLIQAPADAGQPAPEGQPATPPDQWQPANPEGQQPPVAADQQPPVSQPNPEGKYKELVSGMWENVINEMVEKYEKVEELLNNPEQLKDVSKEELMQLYQLRDNLQKNLSEILPALQERSNAQMDSHLAGIEEPEIKEYITWLKADLDEPEEMEALVKVVKDVVAIMKWWKPQEPWQPAPANLKAMGWQDGGQAWSQIDFEKAMLSPDPKVRAEAMKAFDAQLANRQTKEKQG